MGAISRPVRSRQVNTVDEITATPSAHEAVRRTRIKLQSGGAHYLRLSLPSLLFPASWTTLSRFDFLALFDLSLRIPGNALVPRELPNGPT